MTYPEIIEKQNLAVKLQTEAAAGMEMLLSLRRLPKDEEFSDMRNIQAELVVAEAHTETQLDNIKRGINAVPNHSNHSKVATEK